MSELTSRQIEAEIQRRRRVDIYTCPLRGIEGCSTGRYNSNCSHCPTLDEFLRRLPEHPIYMVKAIDQAVKEEQTDWKAKLAEVQGKLDSRDEELDRKEKALKDREKEARANTAYDISEQFTESYVRELMDQFFSTIIPSSQDSGTVQLETMDNQQLDFLKAVTLLREANDRGHELIEKAINKLVSRLRETAEELV